jgi:signal transduction histidine kinase
MTAEYALLVFVLFQMSAIFSSTIRELAAAKEAENAKAREAEDQKRLHDMKSEFLGELSHELRMPISVISGFAQYLGEVIDDEVLDRGDLKSSARRVENEADRMDRLVGQLLDMEAIEAGQFQLKKEITAVGELFEQIAHVYFPMMNLARNRLQTDCGEELSLYADRERILQVLVNLVSNACKYTGEGEIVLTALLEEDRVRFCVADTGEGMTPETVELLFTRYPKMRGGVKGVMGNGLGLFISKKIVEAHGGEIGVESEFGKGTEIWFTIPKGE